MSRAFPGRGDINIPSEAGLSLSQSGRFIEREARLRAGRRHWRGFVDILSSTSSRFFLTCEVAAGKLMLDTGRNYSSMLLGPQPALLSVQLPKERTKTSRRPDRLKERLPGKVKRNARAATLLFVPRNQSVAYGVTNQFGLVL